MSLEEHKKEIRSTAALMALEESIRQLTYEFQGGNAFNFYHEAELAAYLLLLARQKYAFTEYYRSRPVYLARLEWPCVSTKRIDLVLWKPGYEVEARRSWWKPRARVAKEVPLLAAVQIKRGGGQVASWPRTKYDLDLLQDTHRNEKLNKPILYFLEWVDNGIRNGETAQQVYRSIKPELISWCNESPEYRRVLVFSRDRVGFTHPVEAWLVNPLPDGTLATL
jgi:hypothetical protein